MKQVLFLIMFLTLALARGQETVEIPTFKGGQQAYIDFLSRKMKYPQHAVSLRIEGRVFLQFTVKKDGSVADIKLVQGIGGGCDEEAIRVIGLTSGNWFPARKNGEPVDANFNASIKFSLSEERLSAANEFNKGVDYMRSEQYELAVKAFDMAIQMEEGCNKCIYSRGLSLFLMEDYQSAIRDWETVYKRNYRKKEVRPKLSEAYLKIGNKYLNEKKYNIAVVIYGKALEYTPEEINVLNNRANAYFLMGDKVNACLDWKKMKDLGADEANKYLEAYCE